MKSPCTRVKDVFLLFSTYFQQILKVAPNSKKFGEMVLAHQVKLFSPEPTFQQNQVSFYLSKFFGNVTIFFNRKVGKGPSLKFQLQPS